MCSSMAAITYEQLAVDLTAVLAKQESNCNVKNALNFALLEDFDHLYRYANFNQLYAHHDKISLGYSSGLVKYDRLHL